MTEDDARDWILTKYGAAKLAVLERYVELLIAGAAHQNLIAPSTLDTIWSRHIVDSAQLLSLAGGKTGLWIDIGSGAGLPGIVIAVLREGETMLVEPRKRRADFLEDCQNTLGFCKSSVRCCRIEAIKERSGVLSARAVGAIEQLFAVASQCAAADTIWLLPRGKSGADELVQARKSWQGTFHVEQSLTLPESQIVVGTGVMRR